MKTKILLVLMLSTLVIANVSAQPIANASFENWTQQIQYEDPVPYLTTNLNVYMANGGSNITKSTDHHGGSYSAKMQTIVVGTDTIFGAIFIGNPGNGGISGGFPIATRPDSLKAWAKYNVMANDTGHIIVLFKNSGVMIGVAAFSFLGSQANFTQFKTPITWMSLFNPDTMVVIITASNLDGAKMPGSTLYVDDISFTNSTTPFPNGGFETWNTVATENPNNWFTFNFACLPGDTSATKTTDHYDGVYAMKLKSVPLLMGDTMGYLTNGTFGNHGPEGGMPISQNPSLITGYYKYIPVGLDTALAGGISFYYDAINDTTLTVEMNIITLPPASSWTSFNIPFSYNGTPLADTLNIIFASGNAQGNYAGLGSTLFLDKLEIFYMPVGLHNSEQQDAEINIYPNPASGSTNVNISLDNDLQISLELFNSQGQKVYSEILDNTKSAVNSLNLSTLSKGVYFMNIRTKDKYYSKKLVIQ